MDPINNPDSSAAHHLLTELRTRIATQPLPYQHGVEVRALTSMWELFGHARDAMQKNPGCKVFAKRATEVLNTVVRPLTGKWHRAYEEGRLNGRDGADEFRGELIGVQKALRDYARELHLMAYAIEADDRLGEDVMKESDLAVLFEPLEFGFRTSDAERTAVAKEIAKDELDSVRARRSTQIATPEGKDAIGLALSGGGIRSASFALGVVQTLAQRALLKEVDFLSTVSGGGYTGSFLTQRLGNSESLADVASPYGPDPAPICYVRQNARFLSGSNLKERWSMVCSTLAGMFLNWSGPALVLVLLALVGARFDGAYKLHRPLILECLASLSVLAAIAFGLGMRWGKRATSLTGRILGGAIALTALVGATAVLDTVYFGYLPHWKEQWTTYTKTALTIGALLTAIPSVIRFVPVLKNPKVRQWVLKIIMLLTGIIVPVLAVLVFYALLALGHNHWIEMSFAGIALAVVSIFVVNINLTAPHRLYRDGLARTFIQKTPDGSPDVLLTDINPGGTAPYHILNAALNIPSSLTAALKDRGCDFFMFSKKWTGSISTGYEKTGQWKASGQPVDLATAMAISGAAISTQMGLGSMPSLTALLTLLNVRLGFWIKRCGTRTWFESPGFVCLLRETFGVDMTEKSKWLNLSDGGHIENMAVYELLRRRCKFIICVDGEADPDYTFEGLMTLVRHARIDFGVTISPVLDELRPDAVTGYSRSHFHFCRIQYPEGTGMLLYVKLSVTGNESELIRRYRTNHPDFPHQTTLDQFFDQEQFEAYRQLGVHVADGLFKPALMANTCPGSVPEWFRQLAKNLLEPLS